LAAEYAYQNGPYAAAPNAADLAAYNAGESSPLEGVGIFQKFGVPDVLTGKWGSGTGESLFANAISALGFTGSKTSSAYTTGGATGGSAAPSGSIGSGLGAVGSTASGAVSGAAASVSGSVAGGGTSNSSGGILGSVESAVVKDLEVAGLLLGGAAGMGVGIYLLAKRQSQLEEIGWLSLWGGGVVLWSVLTKRSPLCVLQAAVDGTDTSACVGTITGGNLLGGLLTAIAALVGADALSRLLPAVVTGAVAGKVAKGSSKTPDEGNGEGEGEGGGGSGSNAKAPTEPSGGEGDATGGGGSVSPDYIRTDLPRGDEG
jgi:hypothetical protein